MRTASIVSLTSWARMMWAPLATAMAAQVSEPMRRSWTLGWSRIFPIKDLREAPTRRGNPNDRKSASARSTRQSHSSQAIPGSRKNPIPGSSTICCRGMPACSARARLSRRAFLNALQRRSALGVLFARHQNRTNSGTGNQRSHSRIIPQTTDIVDNPGARPQGGLGRLRPLGISRNWNRNSRRSGFNRLRLNVRFLLLLKYQF